MADRADVYGRVTGPGEVRFERLLPGPIERIWAYLTESEKRGKWLAAGAMDLRVGGRVELEFRHADLSPEREEVPEKYRKYEEGGTVSGRITACDPPRRLSYTWGEEEGPDTEVTFELASRGDDVLLVVTHRRLAGPDAMKSVSGGWHTHFSILADVLAGRTPRPFWTTHASLEEQYGKRLAGE
ncbi:MAG: SRPBCC family protein [Thermoanaerobaculia bacterium]